MERQSLDWVLTYVDEHGREAKSNHISRSAAIAQGKAVERQKGAVKSLEGPNEFIDMPALRLLMKDPNL